MASGSGTRLVLLGTAGGPLPSPVRAGISQAVVAGGRAYLVDCGSGVTRQLRRARLLSSLHAVFLTHLHSDHACDYFNLFLLGWPILQWGPPVDVYGPGSAGRLPAPTTERPADRPLSIVNASNPVPGLADLTRSQIAAHAYDINVRIREAGRTDLTELVVPHEIALPPDLEAGPGRVAPPMAPVLVAEDDRVRVTAVLVEHAPVFPAFAYRFDTADGSVVVSGDTAPCGNLVALARGADVLVHEVFADDIWAQRPEEVSWEASQREHHLFTAHTALSQVGKVASEAEVGRLVLTHFVPGDDVLPDEHWLRGLRGTFDGEVTVGSDLLELPL
ncbi:MAG TPA: MBL fold metallo-hydrolase [Egibacteraceae bacterium]|jgi:ribonuclease BN (tRNA processing enzyme)|nr:MBL fold metallo-hydrolase [Egibacteraceae bacterium]